MEGAIAPNFRVLSLAGADCVVEKDQECGEDEGCEEMGLVGAVADGEDVTTEVESCCVEDTTGAVSLATAAKRLKMGLRIFAGRRPAPGSSSVA